MRRHMVAHVDRYGFVIDFFVWASLIVFLGRIFVSIFFSSLASAGHGVPIMRERVALTVGSH